MKPPPDIELTDDLLEEVCERIRKGNYPHIAARACHIPESTWHKWAHQAKDPAVMGVLATLSTQVAAAEATAHCIMVQRIQEAAREPKTWAAAAWYLEHRYPELWGTPLQQSSGGMDLDRLTDDERRIFLELAKRARSIGELPPKKDEE